MPKLPAFRSLICCGVLLAPAAMLLLGCSPSSPPATQPSSWHDQALKDPMGFDPKLDKTDISGGGLMDLDRDAFRRDVDHVFSP